MRIAARLFGIIALVAATGIVPACDNGGGGRNIGGSGSGGGNGGGIGDTDLTLTPLKSVYVNNFLIGGLVENDENDIIYSTGKHYDLLMHHSSTVTAGLFPRLLVPSSDGTFQWKIADQMVDLVKGGNIWLHGHCLVWNNEYHSPEWMYGATKAETEAKLINHVNTVVSHFMGKVNSWDVVNEAIKDYPSAAEAGNWKSCVRVGIPGQWGYNPWNVQLGQNYIELAFRTARAADPNAKLFYNDSFSDWDGYDRYKLEAICNMINDINTRYKSETGGSRNLIEGVGMQSHHYLPNLNVEDVRNYLDKLSVLGIDIAISELDIRMSEALDTGRGRNTVMSEAEEKAQARAYASLFKLYREYPAIKRVTMWCIDDGTSYASLGNPCLFDGNLKAKKAYYAAVDPDGFLAKNATPPVTITLDADGGWGWQYNYMGSSLFNGGKIVQGDKYMFSYSFTSNVLVDQLQVSLVECIEAANWDWKVLSNTVTIRTNIAANTEVSGTAILTATGTAADITHNANRLVFQAGAGTASAPTLTFTTFDFVKNN